LTDGYDPAKAYLHSSDLRWSYGAMRNRPDDWAAQHATKPVAELVPAARQAGFAAIQVDRVSYSDGGAAIEAELRSALGAEPTRSPDTRYLFWLL
jgi:phosphoglycerol transferase